jgi:ABC-2 type transport system permease protein
MLPIIFVMPIVQLVVLVFAANMELKNIDMTVVDRDKSLTSQRLVAKFVGSPYYNVTFSEESIDKSVDDLYEDKSDMILHIPQNFERDLHNEKLADLQVLINAINNTSASLMNGYTNSIVMDYNSDIILEITNQKTPKMSTFQVENSFWYNPELNYKIYMLPGILVILVTVISMFLTALNLGS